MLNTHIKDRLQRLSDPSRGCGSAETPIKGVRLFWSRQSSGPVPLVYDAGIVLVFQGTKTGYLGDREFSYHADQYLVLTTPTPFECATEASPDTPLAGLYVDVDRLELAALKAAMAESGLRSFAPPPEEVSAGLAPVPMEIGMRRAGERLFAMLGDPGEAAVMGDAARQDVLFQALRSPQGDMLAGLLDETAPDQRVDAAIVALHDDFGASVAIEQLARDAGMSASAFHRAFKKRTGYPPLQYLKRIRLHYARRWLATTSEPVAQIARGVGYESVSQFSREYRRLFGEAPTALRQRPDPAAALAADSMRFPSAPPVATSR